MSINFSNFNTFGSMNFGGEFFSQLSMLNMMGDVFSFGNMNTSVNFSALNALSSMNSIMTAMPSFGTMSAPSYNFGSFGTNVRSNNVSLTNNKVSNAISLAKSQIGVTENGNSNNSADVNKYRFGKANGNPWCASFVSWCYGQGQNGNNKQTFGFDESTQSIRRKAEKAGKYSTKASGYRPQVGDLAVWKYNENSGHVGIISKINNDGSFQVVEGNCGNAVQETTRSMGTEGLHGFVRMNEWLQA